MLLDSQAVLFGQNMGILGEIKKEEVGLVPKSKIMVSLCHDKKFQFHSEGNETY